MLPICAITCVTGPLGGRGQPSALCAPACRGSLVALPQAMLPNGHAQAQPCRMPYVQLAAFRGTHDSSLNRQHLQQACLSSTRCGAGLLSVPASALSAGS